MNKNCFHFADVLLPRQDVDLARWSVVACDQYTSQPEYWNEVENYVGDKPSTLHIVYPEVYLSDGTQRVESINHFMEEYINTGIIEKRVHGFVLVVRTTQSGARIGLVGTIDLDDYSFKNDNKGLIRATEGTVESRIPARVTIREHALLESPHVMLLIDDRKQQIIERLFQKRETLPLIYDTELMMNGGHLQGYAVEGQLADEVQREFEKLEASSDGFTFAVGDGNHSLAAAKTCWMNIKEKLPAEKRADHPAKYAMVEVVNLNCAALQFEPIHRLVINADIEELTDQFRKRMEITGASLSGGEDIIFFQNGKELKYCVQDTANQLPVALLQSFLDTYIAQHPECSIDYIHGRSDLELLVRKTGGCGILLKAFDKKMLFPAIKAGGALPRKTFSMGEAFEKRYYMECRSIQE